MLGACFAQKSNAVIELHVEAHEENLRTAEMIKRYNRTQTIFWAALCSMYEYAYKTQYVTVLLAVQGAYIEQITAVESFKEFRICLSSERTHLRL